MCGAEQGHIHEKTCISRTGISDCGGRANRRGVRHHAIADRHGLLCGDRDRRNGDEQHVPEGRQLSSLTPAALRIWAEISRRLTPCLEFSCPGPVLDRKPEKKDSNKRKAFLRNVLQRRNGVFDGQTVRHRYRTEPDTFAVSLRAFSTCVVRLFARISSSYT